MTRCDHWLRTDTGRRMQQTTKVFFLDHARQSTMFGLCAADLLWLHHENLVARRARFGSAIIVGLGFAANEWEAARTDFREHAAPCATAPPHTPARDPRLRWDVWTCDHQDPRARAR